MDLAQRARRGSIHPVHGVMDPIAETGKQNSSYCDQKDGAQTHISVGLHATPGHEERKNWVSSNHDLIVNTVVRTATEREVSREHVGGIGGHVFGIGRHEGEPAGALPVDCGDYWVRISDTRA